MPKNFIKCVKEVEKKMKKLLSLSIIALLVLPLVFAGDSLIGQSVVGMEIVKSNLSIKDNIANLSNGRLAEIKIMPSVASIKAREVLQSKNITIELKEVGNKPVYEAQTEKEVVVLWIFKAKERKIFNYDAETGQINIIKPFWSVLVTRR